MGKAVITEVTRMYSSNICVGAFHLELKKIIRPLPNFEKNWNKSDYDNKTFYVGNIISCDDYKKTDLITKKNPHDYEDWRQDKPRKIGTYSQKELFELLEKHCDKSIKSIFNTKIKYNKYFDSEKPLRSLGSIISKSKNLLFVPKESKKQLRLKILDIDNEIYDFPVTSLFLLEKFDEYKCSIKDMNREFIKGKNKLIIRIGLARDFSGSGDIKFSLPRNYIQVNGLIGI
jgi:hypothetical protein|tara:strand:+ start:305 stop:994 length:690 start_codon:yes stop_codon:yes gene_type:complete